MLVQLGPSHSSTSVVHPLPVESFSNTTEQVNCPSRARETGEDWCFGTTPDALFLTPGTLRVFLVVLALVVSGCVCVDSEVSVSHTQPPPSALVLIELPLEAFSNTAEPVSAPATSHQK